MEKTELREKRTHLDTFTVLHGDIQLAEKKHIVLKDLNLLSLFGLRLRSIGFLKSARLFLLMGSWIERVRS